MSSEVYENLFDALQARSESYRESPALIGDGGRGSRFSYAELFSKVQQLANGLLNQSLMARKEIGLLSENRPEWAIAYLAIMAAGGTVVPIDANLKSNEISFIVDHANLEVLFCSDKFKQTLAGFGHQLRLVSLEEGDKSSINSLLSTDPPQPAPEPNPTAVLIYTSGTTGTPKAVELTHRNLIANLSGVADALPVYASDIFLSVLPLHHTFEATAGLLTPLWAGASVVYARSLKSRDIIEDIKSNKVTVMCGVPLLYEKMHHSIIRAIDSAPAARRMLFKTIYTVSAIGWRVGVKLGRSLFRSLRTKAGLNSIRMFVSGGAPLPARIAAFFNYLGFDFIEGYGMTECSPVISFNHIKDIKFGSVGRPLPNLEVRIDNPNDDRIGEIVVRGDNMTPGYRDNPEQTAELIRDGWLHTGDLGKLEDGHLWICGRAKNLIVSAAGKNIYPEEIEEKILESDFVMETVVFGRRKTDKQGEEVRAILVPDLEEIKLHHALDPKNPDMSLVKRLMGQVVTDANAAMASYKRISDFDVQLEELEKTSTKKVKRFVYR